MKKIFITGSNGFIGKNLVESFKNEYDIKAPLRQELNLLNQEDVELYLERNSFDVVIHSATQPGHRNAKESLDLVLERNLKMFFNLEKCSNLYGKMIYIGSGAEYDVRHYKPMMDEGYFGSHIPEDAHGFSKYIMAKTAEAAENIYDMTVFGIYGKYEDWEIRFISNACCKAMYELPITINKNVFFDYIYISDFIKLLKWFVENTPIYKRYNVCTGKRIDLITLAKIVREVSGKYVDILVEKDDLKGEYTGSNERMLKEVGGFDFMDIRKGIKELYGYYNKNKDKFDKEKLLNDKL